MNKVHLTSYHFTENLASYLRAVAKALFLAILLLASLSTQGEEKSQKFGEYTVDYNMFPSTLISADIAKIYGIKRSKYETLINVFVSKEGQKWGVPVRISGSATNLLQQQQKLVFQEIKEDETVYYIAAIRVTNEELFHFEIVCTLVDDTEEFVVKFTKKLYAD